MKRINQKETQDKLLDACRNCNLKDTLRALSTGAKPIPSFPGTPSPLMYAADCGNIELVQLLLDAGADVTYCDDLGSTALECAAVVGDLRISSLLIERGAGDEPNGQGARPSEYADHHGHPQVAELIRQQAAERRK